MKKQVMVILASLCAMVLSGCFYSAAVGVADVAIVKRTKQKHEFIHAMEDGYAAYQKDWENSGCPPKEYEVSKQIVEYAKSRPPYGLDAAIELLMEIYQDESQSDQVRSHALYHVAVAYMRRRESNYQLAEDYLLKIRDEFPGTHECVVVRLLTEIYEREKFEQSFSPDDDADAS